MRLLLDTHALLWWLDDDPSLSAEARAAVASRANQVYVSAASWWEAGVKQATGKLRLTDDFEETVLRQPFLPLPLTGRHMLESARLPMIHKDPFDRMLVAQCRSEGLALVSRDQLLAGYGIELVPA